MSDILNAAIHAACDAICNNPGDCGYPTDPACKRLCDYGTFAELMIAHIAAHPDPAVIERMARAMAEAIKPAFWEMIHEGGEGALVTRDDLRSDARAAYDALFAGLLNTGMADDAG